MGIHQLLLGGGDRIDLSVYVAPSAVTLAGSGAATAQYQLRNDGELFGTDGTNTVVDRGDWIAPKVNMASYSARMTYNSGDVLSTGTMATYLNLGTSRTWTLTVPVGGIKNTTTTIEIRRDSDSAVVSSATLTWQAEADDGS